MKMKKVHREYIVFLVPIILSAICLFLIGVGSQQASLPVPMPQGIVGEYSYDGENWQELTENSDISALKGDLYIRGNLLRAMEEGWRLNYYRNHIGVSIKVNGQDVYKDSMLAIPNLHTKLFASMCTREWMNTIMPAISVEDTVEIYMHNPHAWGNRTAYKDFLTTLCSDQMGWNLLEQNLASRSEQFRIWGGLLSAASLMLLGGAIAAYIAHISVGGMLLKMGLLTLFVSGYIVFDAIDVSYWNELNVLNTYTVQLCMMMAAFCLGDIVSDALTGKRQQAAKMASIISALFNGILIVLACVGVAVIFDMLLYWVCLQILLCIFFIVCCVAELLAKTGKRFGLVSAILVFCAILMDIAGVGSTILWRAPCSKIAFSVLFCVHIVVTARAVVMNYRASARAEKLEKELEDSRIAIMLSQIKPHFLYNVLNTIYHLYRKEPETAQEAVNSFAEYLRCNMISIEKSEPISFREEYRHIQTYLSLEQIRFRGKLDVVYDVETTDFKLPPLTVEPLVENAVKHGVTKKRGGGEVVISTRKTADSILVTVSDNGVGFDPDNYMADGKPHVGIRNIRNRLHNMVGGTLSITSSEKGTVAIVSIPIKEVSGWK